MSQYPVGATPVEQPNQPLLKDIMVEYNEFYGRKTYKIEECREEIGIQLEVENEMLRNIRSDNAETEYRQKAMT